MLDFHTWFSARKAFLAFCNLDLMSSQASPSFVTFDPRYVNSGISSRSFPSIFTGLSTLTFNLMVFVLPALIFKPALCAHSSMAVVLSWRSLNLLESRAMSSAKSRSSSLRMNVHLNPMFFPSTLFLMTQSNTRRKWNIKDLPHLYSHDNSLRSHMPLKLLLFIYQYKSG